MHAATTRNCRLIGCVAKSTVTSRRSRARWQNDPSSLPITASCLAVNRVHRPWGLAGAGDSRFVGGGRFSICQHHTIGTQWLLEQRREAWSCSCNRQGRRRTDRNSASHGGHIAETAALGGCGARQGGGCHCGGNGSADARNAVSACTASRNGAHCPRRLRFRATGESALRGDSG